VAYRIFVGVVWGCIGYVAGAFSSGFLINQLSSNTHDRSVEAAMTGAFVVGPLVALAAFVAGFVRTKKRG
jgi:hypothetical protein